MEEPPDPSDDQARRAEKEEHHRKAIQNYSEELRRRKTEDNAKFNGLEMGDVDKKLKSQLYLAIGKEGQKCFSHKNPGKRISDINFAEFWELFKTTFTVSTNLTYERFKFFGRRQKEHEPLEKIHETLSEFVKKLQTGGTRVRISQRHFHHKYAKRRDSKETMYRILDPRKCTIACISSREKH